MVWLKSSSDSLASSSLLLKELIKDEQTPPPLTLNESAGHQWTSSPQHPVSQRRF